MKFSHSCPAYPACPVGAVGPVGPVDSVGGAYTACAVGPTGSVGSVCAASLLFLPVRSILSALVMVVNLLLFCQRSDDVFDVCTSLKML